MLTSRGRLRCSDHAARRPSPRRGPLRKTSPPQMPQGSALPAAAVGTGVSGGAAGRGCGRGRTVSERLGDRVEDAGFDESAGLLMWCGHFQAAFEAFSWGQSLVDVATDLHGEPSGSTS